MVSKLVMIKVLSTNEPPIEPSQILWLTQQKELNKIKLRRVMPCLEKSAQVATDDPITVSNSKVSDVWKGHQPHKSNEEPHYFT